MKANNSNNNNSDDARNQKIKLVITGCRQESASSLSNKLTNQRSLGTNSRCGAIAGACHQPPRLPAGLNVVPNRTRKYRIYESTKPIPAKMTARCMEESLEDPKMCLWSSFFRPNSRNLKVHSGADDNRQMVTSKFKAKYEQDFKPVPIYEPAESLYNMTKKINQGT
jgi:hypothetical protein